MKSIRFTVDDVYCDRVPSDVQQAVSAWATATDLGAVYAIELIAGSLVHLNAIYVNPNGSVRSVEQVLALTPFPERLLDYLPAEARR